MNQFRRGQSNYDQFVRNIRNFERLTRNYRTMSIRSGELVRKLYAAQNALHRSLTRDDSENTRTGYRIQVTKLQLLLDEHRRIQDELRLRLHAIKQRMSGIIFGNNRVLPLNDPGWNTQNFIERLRHVRGTRLARLIERLYLRPGGPYSKKIVGETMANVNALKKKQNAIVTIQRHIKSHIYSPGSLFVHKQTKSKHWNKNPNTRPNRNNFNNNEAFNRAMNNWRRRGAPGSSKG